MVDPVIYREPLDLVKAVTKQEAYPVPVDSVDSVVPRAAATIEPVNVLVRVKPVDRPS